MASDITSIGSSNSLDTMISARIADIRTLQTELRTRPVTGSMRGVKKLFYQIIRSTFSRQHALNAATLDLIETIYRETGRQRPAALPTKVAAPTPFDAPPAEAIDTGQVLASSGQMQDQAELNRIRPLTGFNAVYSSPAEMRMPERVALYGLVFGLQPRNILEVGTFRGGSTAIICGALDDTGFGQVACVDPMPQVDAELWGCLQHRCRMFTGPSPGILPTVAQEVGAPFDFALIDGNHTYDYLRADITGVLPLMADDAYLLFHDAHYGDVKRAIDEAVKSHRTLIDCGLVSVEPTVLHENGQTTAWAGFRLLRFQRSKG
jgi:predicted O-methyltransferase YrrM